MNAWLIVLIAGVLETGWAMGLKYSEGFTRPIPSIVTIVLALASFWMLSVAMKTLPVGTAYAVWTGIGTVGHRIDPGLGGGDAHLHVHQLVADRLTLDQGRAKGMALACPVQRFVKASLRKAQRHGRHGQALAVEVAHDHLEARAFVAQAVTLGHAHAIKAQLRGV